MSIIHILDWAGSTIVIAFVFKTIEVIMTYTISITKENKDVLKSEERDKS